MPMRVKIVLAVVLVALAGVIAWQVLRKREPVYQGKPLSFWLKIPMQEEGLGPQRLPELEVHYYKELNAPAAIRQIGTNALPLLIERLQAQDTRLKQLMMRWAREQKFVHFPFKSADQHRNEAIRGYEALGPLASAQVPTLADMVSHDPSPSVRRVAVSALGYIGPEARSAAPALFRATQDTNEMVRGVAFWALGRILPDPQLTIPVLVAGLGDPLRGYHWQAAVALGEYGPEARAAVPALLRALATNDAFLSSLGMADRLRFNDPFRSALKRIDPEAAAKAGVK